MVGLGSLLARRRRRAPLAARRAGRRRAATPGTATSPTPPSPPGAAVDHRANGFDPTELLRDFDYGKTRRLASGRVLREWEIVAQDREIEVAPGVKYEAWTYNGRVPGRPCAPARARGCGSASSTPPNTRTRCTSTASTGPLMDGMPGIGESGGGGQIEPGEDFTYEFDAAPFGLHLYHCHVAPLAAHISRGLYGAFIIDPKQGRPEADEMVMVMNGFDTNFDLANEVYAVNTVGFHYVDEPIQVARDELRPHLPGQRARVRPAQLLPRPRQLLPVLPDRDLAAAERVHRHGDPGPGAARRSSS